jgi:pyruvate/2-oxoglutarate dehydrogenase complex dihydrolipoamide acyltransferase (E2) component
MIIEINMQQIGNEEGPYELTEWFVIVGDSVVVSQVLCVVEVNKAQVEVLSDQNAVVKELLISEGDEFQPLTPLCRLEI